MSGNSIGDLFKVTSFGESHGKCIGVIVDGCPAGLKLSEETIQKELNKRRPFQDILSTSRKEEDKVEILSGVFNGLTTGAPICMVIWNKDFDSTPYEDIRFTPRPGHADYTAYIKYGGFNDYRGGGRFSGRVTAGFVMAGAIAKRILELVGIEVLAYTLEIGGVRMRQMDLDKVKEYVERSPVRCPDLEASERMLKMIENAKFEGDSLGGIVECVVLNVPAGLGMPVFDTLEGDISKALYAIPAVKGVEFGAGFNVSKLKGSENNDQYTIKDGRIVTVTNNAGGILGGISSGMPIVCRVAIKPPSSISKKQYSIDLIKMEKTTLLVRGRHDVCIVPRVLPVVESMVAIVLVDHAMKTGMVPKVIKDVMK
ncbi:MAG: chorismate synthase [Nitrososphaeria archaeon]